MPEHLELKENIFNLPAPSLYRCHVHHYHTRLSRLYIRVFKAPQGNASTMQIPAFYVLFSDVGYVEGPINWEGANFCIAQHQECIDLMLETGMIGKAVLQFPDAYAAITDTARLYVVKTEHSSVRIIASSAARLPSLPPELS